jgi:hypothetical protein
MLSGKIVAGHVEWPAKIIPLGHGKEGESDVVVHCLVGIGGESINCIKPLL